MKELKAVIINQNEKLWSLYIWNKVFSKDILKDKLTISGFFICNERFGNIEPKKVKKWYFETFGSWNFLILGLFSFIFKTNLILRSLTNNFFLSFKSLCRAYQIEYFRVSDPNHPEIIKWINKNNIDLVIINTGHIIKKILLNAPGIGIINKHSSLLPSFRGIFPYFWAVINKGLQGVTFYKISEKIDEGEIIFQKKIEDKKALRSMISFYFYIHKDYHSMLQRVIDNLMEGKTTLTNPDISNSYFGLPNYRNYLEFRQAKGNIIVFKDLFLPFCL